MALITEWKKNRAYTLPSGRVIIRISMIVSLLFHVFILIIAQKAFPINWFPEPLRTYHVELLRPPVDPFDDKETADADLAKIKADEKAQPVEAEDTISLDTKDKRYTSYAIAIKARLIKHWEYPREARENLIEGKVLIVFSLNRQGHLKEIRILQPSGYDILNKEAERAIRSAAPFPPFP
ncbi:MAG: energy transducer TonB, partial [Pseudomonadota bacterium]